MNARGLRLAPLVLKCLCRVLPAGLREESYAEWSAELQPVRDACSGQGRLTSAGRVFAYCAGHAVSVVRLRRIYRKPRGAHHDRARRRAGMLVWGATAAGTVIGLAAPGSVMQQVPLDAVLACDERLLLALLVLWAAWIRVSLIRMTRIIERRAARRRAGAQGASW